MPDEEQFNCVDSKFPGQDPTGLPPFPSAENPGRVFPKTDPNIPIPQPKLESLRSDRLVGNPYLMQNALNKVDQALGEVISLLEQEESSQDRLAEEDALFQKFKTWRDELADISSGKVIIPFPKKYGGLSSSTHVDGIFRD